MMRRCLPLLAVLATAPLTAATQPPEPLPGCVQERLAEVSSDGLALDADGDRVAFITSDDPLGTDPGHLGQIFLWRPGLGFERLVGTNRARTGNLAMDASGRRIAFTSDAPITPGNRHRGLQVFLWIDPTGTVQVTDNDLDETFESSIDASGTRIVFDRAVIEAPVTNPVRHELVLWEEGSGERTIASLGPGPAELESPDISGDGRRVVFVQSSGLVAEPTLTRLWDEGSDSVETAVDLGPGPIGSLSRPSIDGAGDRFVFSAPVDPLGTNPDGGNEVFLWDAADGLSQITDSASGHSFRPSISDDGRAVAFLSDADPFGANPSHLQQVFLWREAADGSATLTQVTAWEPGPNPEQPGGAGEVAISRDGQRLAHWRLQGPPVGEPGLGLQEIWLSDCAVPPPPFEAWIDSPDLPGFEVQVRIGGERRGEPEPLCIEETLCVSGAVPGRSEVFVRVVGPKPNGRLWPTLVKFSTSEVEVWIRQLGTGEIEYYRLRGARPGFDELPGLFDREGFEPL